MGRWDEEKGLIWGGGEIRQGCDDGRRQGVRRAKRGFEARWC